MWATYALYLVQEAFGESTDKVDLRKGLQAAVNILTAAKLDTSVWHAVIKENVDLGLIYQAKLLKKAAKKV